MPTRSLFDLSRKAGHASYSQQVAAVGVWVLECLKRRGYALTNWTAAQDQEVLRQLPKQRLDERGLDERWSRLGLKFEGHWSLHNGDWDAYFEALLAVPNGHHLQGAAAKQSLENVGSASTRIRIMTFETAGIAGKAPERGMIAAVVESDALYLLDPTRGLWRHEPASAVELSAGWFRDRMQDRGSGKPIRATCWLVRTVDVFFAWFGPPARPKADGTRPDLAGPLSVAAAPSGDKNPPKLKFFCLERYRQAFDAALPGVQMESIESYLPTVNDQGHHRLAAPTYGDLGACVATVISESIRPPRNVRRLVNAKNIWSLYCLWRFGGYHLDTGVLKAPDAPEIKLPRPERFSVMTYYTPENGKIEFFRHVTGQFNGSGLKAAALVATDTEFVLQNQVLRGIGIKDTPTGQFRIRATDVGLMRSPRHDPGVERALRFYLCLWFRIRERDGVFPFSNQETLKAAYRNAIISAALTGVTHPKPEGDGTDLELVDKGRDGDLQKRVFETSSSATFTPASLGLIKTGESSHRN